MGMRGSGVPAGRCGSGSESGRRITSANDVGRGEAPRGSAATAALAATPVRNDRRLRWMLTILKFGAADHRSCPPPPVTSEVVRPKHAERSRERWSYHLRSGEAGRLLQE